MTEKQVARFALVLKECERIRAMIAWEEAAAGELPLPSSLPGPAGTEQASGSAAVAAA